MHHLTIYNTDLPDVVLIEPPRFADSRGYLMESFRSNRYFEALGVDFVQDNFTNSHRGVLRGLHCQLDRPQGKLVWVARGEIFDVVVDLREGSPAFGRWSSFQLNSSEPRQLYIPPGFAHGFYVISEHAEVSYKCTEYYNSESQFTIRWNDADLAIRWPVETPLLSEKDSAGLTFKQAPVFSVGPAGR